MSDWLPVTNSSNVAAVREDPDRAELYVRFKDGSMYTYSSVPEGIAQQLLEAPSPGRFVREDLAIYQYERRG